MDGQHFDRMARRLATSASRRTVLRGLAAGLAGAAGLRALRAEAGQEKKPLCHATGDPANPWVVIDVAEPAWDTHYAHGDHAYDDCCADADCASPATCGGGGVAGQCGVMVQPWLTVVWTLGDGFFTGHLTGAGLQPGSNISATQVEPNENYTFIQHIGVRPSASGQVDLDLVAQVPCGYWASITIATFDYMGNLITATAPLPC